MGSASPIQAFNQASFDGYHIWSSFVQDVHVHDSAAAALAKEASLLPPAVAHTVKVSDGVVVRELKEGKDGGCAEGAG